MNTVEILQRKRQVMFAVGDYLAGALTGAVTAAAVRAVVNPGLDMVLAMLIGTAVGMITHLAVGFLLAPLLGLFHCMIPGGLTGMYGGMLFAMRDAMQHHPGSLGRAIVVGIVFGAVVTASVRLYDRALRTPIGTEAAT